MVRCLLPLANVVISLTGICRCAESPSTPIDVGSRLEVLWDAALIERMDGVTFKLHPPQPKQVVMNFDRSWEGPRSAYVSVFQDGDLYRMYYRGQGEKNTSERVTCYAESKDGIAWTRPSLGLIEREGSKENNVILRGSVSDNFSAFLDGRPDVPTKERFKGVGGGFSAYVSADGIRWQRLAGVTPGTKPLPANVFDSQNVAFWDTFQKQYVCYFRGRRSKTDVRAICRTTSKDFLTWTDWEFLDLGDTPEEHLYTSAAIPYFRAPHLCLAFPKRFIESRQVSDGVFMTSRDGLRFERRFLEAFLRPGPDEKNWTDRNMMVAYGMLPLSTGELSIYWTENHKHATNRLRRGVVRTDGFVSVNAPYSGGDFVTKPLRFTGKELLLNYATSAAGSIRVELQDSAGIPLPGRTLGDCLELYGDRLDAAVRWKQGTDVSSWQDQAVRLRFVLKDADLYSLRFR